MGTQLKQDATDTKQPPQAVEDPLVNYLEYVVPEADKRNPLSAYLLRLAVEALREKPANGTAELQ